jgi:RNA polymerase sigma factor (sigma-70 family)
MAARGGIVTTDEGAGDPAPGRPEGHVLPPGLVSAGVTPSAEALSPLSFADLYLRSFAAMVRLARVLVDSPDTAEDLVQDAFVRLHRRWTGVRDPHAYLRRCVVNACRSHHRRAWRERGRSGHEAGRPGLARPDEKRPVDGPATEATVDGRAEQARADDAGVLVHALATLPYRQRAALVLRYYADLSDADIAMALGCRPGTVPSLVHRGLNHLRGVMRDER